MAMSQVMGGLPCFFDFVEHVRVFYLEIRKHAGQFSLWR